MTFSDRRTIRAYSDKPLTDSELNDMLAEAFRAPTTGGMQLYSVVVTRSPQGRDALMAPHYGQPMIQTSQAVLTFCADVSRFSRWCVASGAQPVFDNLQGLVAASLDAVIVAQQFCAIAEHTGLGTCYLGTTTYNAAEIAQALDLPKLVVPVITVTVGYPAEPLPPQTYRLPEEGLIHRETYRDESEEEVKTLYADLDALEQSKKFVEDNGKQSLAQVFTDVRYPASSSESTSQAFRDFLVAQGFRL